ncbi:MAG: radical SAM protein [Clostridiaceae bacterium]|nr:radical SAM protein [Clostridiaceae bacterium]MBW4858949.1 radical SAM protein [Clostridiaceae bacterium]MBW4869524.1 radical SAM protein [Clostridiaceae bacterium]
MYPILSPNVHLNRLSDELSVLTNFKNMSTKCLQKYQQLIIDECVGLLTTDEIKSKLRSNGVSEVVVSQVDQYINKMIEWGYLIWSPTQNVLTSNAGIARDKLVCKSNSTALSPNGLHTITISILDSCCLKCSYCSQSSPTRKSHILSFEKISEILTDAYDLGARYLGIFGGEPMMHPDIIEIVRFAYSLGYRYVHIFTRGTLIDHQQAKKLHSVGVNEIQVTVDSHIPDKYDEFVGVQGSFNKMFRALFYLQDVGIEIFLKSIVTSTNISDMFDTVLFFKDIGIKNIGLEVVVPVGRANYKQLPEYKDVLSLQKNIDKLCSCTDDFHCNLTYLKYGIPKQCAGGICSIFVFADGETGPCDKSHYLRKEISFGNIHDMSLKEIWKSNEKIKFRDMRNNDERCVQCKLSKTCLGGCFLNSYIINNESGADPMCSYISGKTSGMFPQCDAETSKV